MNFRITDYAFHENRGQQTEASTWGIDENRNLHFPIEVSLELERFKLDQKLQRYSLTESGSAAPRSTVVPAGTPGGERP